jgi:hypothetical protein
MPQIQTTYDPGSTSTTTPGAPGPGGPSEIADFYKELLRRKLLAQGVPQPSYGGGGGGPAVSPALAAPGRDEGFDLQDQNFKHMQQRDQLLQQQARQNPAPTRGVTGFNMIGSAGGADTLDPMSMNAYQKAVYMPQGSQQVYGPEHEGAARKKLSEDLAWQKQMDAMRSMASY